MGRAEFRVLRKAWCKSLTIDRTDAHGTTQEKQERNLSEWRDELAYVLLGDPGSGKTESLKAEAEAMGGLFVSAALIQENLAPCVNADALVFIDAVDEVKGSGGGNVVGAIARYLRDNGKPRFRIACREADWRVDADRELLEAVAPNGQLKELHLSPLDDQDIQDILNSRSKDLPYAQAFTEQAKTQGVQDWLRNPLLLNLMVDSVAQNGQLPDSRSGIYEAACHAMAHEHNDIHREKQALSAGVVQNVIEDAGVLCVLLLLSGKSAISRNAKPESQVLVLPSLPKDLKLHDTEQAVKSKLFSTEGDLISPRHRTIAEFLGAQALAKRIDKGLPLSRVLALVQGHDGVPVESMRGLCAWLAVYLKRDQRRLVLEADPLGFIINGDVAELTHDERLQLIRALAELSQQNPWFRNGQWEGHPFGSLATPDMQEVFAHELERPEKSKPHQVFIDCLLSALEHAPQPMPALAPMLAQWVTDEQAQDFVRMSAYLAWRRHTPIEAQGFQVKIWLDALENQRQQHKSLIDALLLDAYPMWVQADVLRYLPSDGEGFSVWRFWSYEFTHLTPSNLLPSLARAWLEKFPNGLPVAHNFERKEVAVALLEAVLEKCGAGASHQDLYEWLAIGLNEFGLVDQDEKSGNIVLWLQARPELVKAVAKLCWANVKVDQWGGRSFDVALERLRRVSLPVDWVRWQMTVAMDAVDVDMVRYLLSAVTTAVLGKRSGFDLPTTKELTKWIHVLSTEHPEAAQWFEETNTQVLRDLGDNQQWQAKDDQRRVRYQEERELARQNRLNEIKPHLDQWPEKPLPANILSGIAGAYEKHISDIRGETPESRIADYLGDNLPQYIEKSMTALDASLLRDDLPTVKKIIETAEENKWLWLQMPCLLAARRASERDPQVWRKWPESTQQKLFAFWLTYAAENPPSWFISLGAEYPNVVATVLLDFAKSKFNKKEFHFLTGLWQLSEEATWQALAERVLPDLLNSFPANVGQEGNRVLSRNLLKALHRLPPTEAKSLVEKKLKLKSLDGGQRIAWLVAWLPYEPVLAVEALVAHVDNVEAQHRRILMLHHTFADQGIFSQGTTTVPAACIQRLIEWMAPLTPRIFRQMGEVITVTDDMQREDDVLHFIRNLGNNPSPEAATALRNLMNNVKLTAWSDDFRFYLQQQQRLQREAEFQTVSVQAVARVLCNQGPANASDLLALVVDHLKDLERELRGGTVFQLRYFWHGDIGSLKAKKTKRDRAPSIENDCTLELLALLRPRLEKVGVTLVNESEKANQKRVDLEAVCAVDGQRIALPIEAKREDNKDVWTAWRDQLQRLYTIDPGAQGHGIYLVYWFGGPPKSAPPLDASQPSVKPQSATEMQTMLEERIPSKDRHLLKVVVLDFSWPDEPKTGT